MKQVVYVSNMPAPYRVPVYDLVQQSSQYKFDLVYLTASEPDRNWRTVFDRSFVHLMKSRTVSFKGRFIHWTPGLYEKLKSLSPDVIILTGYNPAHLVGAFYAIFHKTKLIIHTDGTMRSEANQSYWHRLIRRLLSFKVSAYIGTGESARELYVSHGAKAENIFISRLAVDNEMFRNNNPKLQKKEFDLIFVGRFEEIKRPLFVIDIAEKLSQSLGRTIHVVFIGSGSLDSSIRERLKNSKNISALLPGFVQPEHLPSWFHRSRVFVLPSTFEPWGLVANEAAAAGLPIVSTDVPGSVGEIIWDGVNGKVVSASATADEWALEIAEIISNSETMKNMSWSSERIVKEFTFSLASAGIKQAIFHAIQ